MKLSFRWFGDNDPVSLQKIKQIPGMKGIVSALHDIPAGEVWPYEKIVQLKRNIESFGFEWVVVESVPVHEDIKLGLPTREYYVRNYIETLKNISKAGIPVVCYNFMPVYSWTRSSLAYPLEDGSNTLAFEAEKLEEMNPLYNELTLPAWEANYGLEELRTVTEAYADVSEEKLWENLEYFIKAIMPSADSFGIKMAMHPDDPPWSIFGLPRIMTNKENLDRLVQMYDSASNGLCICSGSLGSSLDNNVPDILRYFGEKGRVNFVHARNVKVIGKGSFLETAHLSSEGSVDMYELISALSEFDYGGPIRSDHGRMIWGEEGRPGYGLYDRALGAVYLNGLWEGVRKDRKKGL